MIKRISLKQILQKPSIVCLTAYTVPIANLVDGHVDLILVGDSLGQVLYGYESTRQVTIEMMINHAKAVVKATKKSFVVVDMPYGSYQNSKAQALKNAKKILSQTGAMAVKLEGGENIQDTARYLIDNKINVMGHIGMMPQYQEKPRVYGSTKREKIQFFKDALSLEKAGVFSIVVECTFKKLVDDLVKSCSVPIIGIGASTNCKGQIMVTEDILDMTKFNSKFSKKYFNFFENAKISIKKYSDEVRNKKYPKRNQCY